MAPFVYPYVSLPLTLARPADLAAAIGADRWAILLKESGTRLPVTLTRPPTLPLALALVTTPTWGGVHDMCMCALALFTTLLLLLVLNLIPVLTSN